MGDGIITNEERCNFVMGLFDVSPYDEDAEDGSIIDILTDLQHLCAQQGWDFEEKLRTARMHFGAEGGRVAEPDLLKALEDLLLELHDGITPILHGGNPGAFDVCTQRIARVRTAIAKAKGLTPCPVK